MKKKNTLIAVVLTAAGILVLSAALFLPPKRSREVRRFEDEFGLNLPGNTEVVFSEDHYGAMGDGSRLYIFQLGAEDMKQFSKQGKLCTWAALPFIEDLSKSLRKGVDGLSSRTISEAMKLDAQKGRYIVKNRYNRPLKGYDIYDKSYYNIVIGIVDTEKNRIYFYTWDM